VPKQLRQHEGPLSGFYGKAGKASDGKPDITLYVKGAQAYQESCFHK
jgi:hypothetical protein